MKFQDVYEKVKGIPFITEKNAKILYDTVVEKKLHTCLELGFAYGTSACYMAAAIDEIGGGQLTAVDIKEAAVWQNPSIEELLEKCGLTEYVRIVRGDTGYNWFLHDEIVACTEDGQCVPKYDFAIIDGAKNWTIDGLAFFLTDKVLKKDGWLVFDDYNWTYAIADERRDSSEGIEHSKLSEAEYNMPHVKEIFQLLVMQHPDYSNFKLHGIEDWAWAQKVRSPEKTLRVEYQEDYRDIFSKAVFKLRNLTRGTADPGMLKDNAKS